MEAEELAERARRLSRARFRQRMRGLIAGDDAERQTLREDWKPVADLSEDRHRRDEGEPGVPGIANV